VKLRRGYQHRLASGPGTWAAAVMLAAFVLVGLTAQYLSPFDPQEQRLTERLRPPFTSVKQSRYLLGTDEFGRDILSRTIYGTRVSLSVGSIAVLLGCIGGSTSGLVAGYFGGWMDEVIMMFADTELAIPYILLAIAVVALFGSSLTTLTLVLGVSGWMTYARVVRAQILTLRERQFVEAAHAVGASNGRILLRHLLPNCAAPIIVMATLDLPRVIQLEAALDFFGLGVPPSTATWGAMLQEGRGYMDIAPWLAMAPGIALLLVSLSANELGDWLRNLLSPSWKGGIR